MVFIAFGLTLWRKALAPAAVALGLVAGGRARIGERLFVPTPRGALPVVVAAAVFLDPEGRRAHG